MRLRDTRLRDEINALRLAVPHLVAFSGVQKYEKRKKYTILVEGMPKKRTFARKF